MIGQSPNPLPYSGLRITAQPVSIASDSRTATVSLLINSDRLQWNTVQNGLLASSIEVAAAGFDKHGNSSRVIYHREDLAVQPDTGIRESRHTVPVRLTIPLPHSATQIRYAVRDEQSGEVGAATVQDLSKFPKVPAVPPELHPNRPSQSSPAP